MVEAQPCALKMDKKPKSVARTTAVCILRVFLLLFSCRCNLGPVAKLVTVQLDLRRRGGLAVMYVTPCHQTQSRMMKCNKALHGGDNSTCTADRHETKDCNTDSCRKYSSILPSLFSILSLAIDAYWAPWGTWGACTETCGPAVSLS